ncbi:hypothetical protein CEXT_675191 [Caerostris extrusa]|uniref:Uncharacterized protein n=1 Tax=Caerostris extrusa TaxID=172846 RepID=A0AAV4TPQ5_CAEEX|nr:hypothetical protein CEXT_675191 [Caerostris extrusa]
MQLAARLLKSSRRLTEQSEKWISSHFYRMFRTYRQVKVATNSIACVAGHSKFLSPINAKTVIWQPASTLNRMRSIRSRCGPTIMFLSYVFCVSHGF